MDTNPNDLTTPDLLALLPHVFGAEPRNALAILTFRGARLGTAFTLALPGRETEAAARRLASEAIGAVCSVPDADTALLAVYTERSCPSARVHPFERLQSFVAARLHWSGFHLADSFYVAANGWGSYLCDEPECRLATPNPLAELRRRTRELGDGLER
ncbi:MAG TPA: DUF4192 family protein [Terrimesophilobacter sp.]|nr:DUF4192 family protein [Terrimesophilobacter sp.]